MVDPNANGYGIPQAQIRGGILEAQMPFPGSTHSYLGRSSMEYRQFGGSGLRVPALTFGTATFGGKGEFFKAWGSTDVAEAKRLVSLCLEAGVNFFDTANVYSTGSSEEIL